ncbi:MAG: uncharacterized protein JWP01_2476 [Myxococcales bacterium]|nr:uncharacterized protein [Myxococcales bacterium]
MEINRQGAADAREPRAELDQWARAVITAAIEVHRALGPGFLESVYEDAMIIELATLNLATERQVVFPIAYRNRVISEARLDLLIEGELVVERKAVSALVPLHTAQMISYLKAGAFQLGLLINFNVTFLRQGIRRVIWNR